jgi:hypothetical protein
MNKFIKAIAGTAEGIKLQRATNTAEAARLAQQSLINDKRTTVQTLVADLTNHLDIGPDSSDSLRPVGRDFDANDWVAQVQQLKFAVKRAEDQLDIAEATYAEWFGDEQPTGAPVR